MTTHDGADADVDEERRLRKLAELAILDTAPEADYDRIVQLACTLFRVPIATVSLVDRDRQWFKAKLGLAACETARDISFCTHTIAGDAPLVVADALSDPRFASSPLVTAEPRIRFYAGAPLILSGGERIGALCLIDTVPRAPLDARETAMLQTLAQMTVDRMQARRLQREHQVSAQIARTGFSARIFVDAEGAIVAANPAAGALLGDPGAVAPGRAVAALFRIRESDGTRCLLQRLRDAYAACDAETSERFELDATHADGRALCIEATLSTWEIDGRRGAVLILRDVTEQRSQQAALQRLAHFDTLTGLPNRNALAQTLQGLPAGHGRVLLLLGFDGFNQVNDSLGHEIGDHVLRKAAQRLRALAPESALVARFGGDEFALLLGEADAATAQAAPEPQAQWLLAELVRPYRIGNELVHVRASAGLACLGCGTAGGELIAHAELALYQAKAAGPGRLRVYNRAMREQARARRSLDADLHRAFAAGEFALYYQPQVALDSGALIGAEALLRWRHPQRGVLPACEFIDALARSSAAPAVGAWILQTACADAAGWAPVRGRALTLAVNLFPVQIEDDRLLDDVAAAYADTALPPQRLELELTENIALHQHGDSAALLARLRQCGVRLAFDDFGTGFASLSLLRRLPVDRLKIDRGFVRDILQRDDDATIVRSIIAIARKLGLRVVAEGVECAQQAQLLRRMGCHEAQGFHLGRPMPAAEFAALTRTAACVRSA